MADSNTTVKELTAEERGIIKRGEIQKTEDWASKSNYLVMNYGSNPLVGYNFMLRVEGIYDLPCKSIQFSPKENEYEYIQEGGLNDYVHMKRKPISKPFTFKVERYVGIDYIDPIPNGAELILPVILLISRQQADFGRSLRTFVFTGCKVMSKEFGTLDSEKSGLLTETTTISYNEMLCVDNPLDFKGEGWKFDGSLKGSGKQHARYYSGEKRRTDKITDAEKEKWTQTGEKHYTNGYETYEKNKASKDKLIEAAEKTKWTQNGNRHYTLRYDDFEAKKISKETLAEQAAEDMWRFEKKNKRGNRKQHAATAEKYGIKEPYATEMAQIAKENQWQFDGDKKEGNGVRHATGYKAFGSKERSKEKMASLAEKNHWKFNKKNKKGMGRRNGNIDPQELTKKQLAAKAKLWPETSSAKQPAMESKEMLAERAAKEQWKFADKTKDGNGVRHANGYQKYGSTETGKEEMISLAAVEQWKFADKTKGGNGVRHANGYQDYGSKEATKETMKAAAEGQKWKFDDKKKGGKGARHANGYDKIGSKEATKEAMKAAAEEQRWQFDEKKKGGNGVRHTNGYKDYGSNEVTKETMKATAEERKWQFDEKKKGGNGVRHTNGYQDYGAKEATKEIMKAAAEEQRWQFDDKKKGGNGVRHTNGYKDYGSNEVTKETMKAAAEKEQWKFDQTTKGGNGVRHANGYEDYGKKEATKEALASAAEENRWKFDGNSKKGSGKQNGNIDSQELTRKDLEAKAQLWPSASSAHPPKMEAKDSLVQRADREQWKFSDKKKGGNKVRHANGYQEYGAKEKTKETMISSAEQNHWKFNGHSKKGLGKQNGNINPQELTKKDLEKKAKLWPSVSSAAQIVEYLKKK